jgi:hypothetical protein
VYLALYGPEGLVIFDHPYNAEYLRLAGEQIGVAVARGLLVRRCADVGRPKPGSRT